jgi:hypothetical protein
MANKSNFFGETKQNIEANIIVKTLLIIPVLKYHRINNIVEAQIL